MENIILSKEIAEKVNIMGGIAYYVGGYIRDVIKGDENFDIDIEIHGIDKETLEKILSSFGNVNITGKSFGVYKINHYDIDIALPRKEISTGIGHRDFYIEIDPFIGVKNAAKRRDFTINSIMQNILTDEIIDNYNGINDIKNKTIRHVEKNSFAEDPLRVFRAAQFASRFEYKIAGETIKLCKTIDTKSLSKERIYEETNKALTKSNYPSKYFNSLSDMNQLDFWYNEIEKLKYIEQNPVYHKEGNVYNHTMLVLDKASFYKEKVNNKLFFMYSALCHDLGKINSTQIIDGKIHSYKHELTGIEVCDKFLKRITNNKKLIKYVKNMIENHMKPNMYANDNSKISSSNKLFYDSIAPLDLIYLALSDHFGRITEEEIISPENYLFERYELYKQYMKRDYVKGDDLIKLGIKPSKVFSELIIYANKLRLSGVEKKSVLKQIRSYYKLIEKNYEI